jgi:tetratricopeptide (TPR) repeat protein
MHPTQLCIVARPMSRPTRVTPILVGILLIIGSVGATGCDELDGRNRTRQGNRLFRETHFIDAVAEYEKALKTVNDPIIHYNLGLAYSKIFKPQDKAIRLGVKGSFVCEQLPSTKTESARVCIKSGDRRFDDCDEQSVCASSYQCTQTELCVYEPAQVAELAADHWQKWLAANPTDDDTRKLMTQVWIDGEQFKLAIDYWESLLAAKPGNTEIMGNLAGINLKAGDWRKSIDWYLKVANTTPDQSQKVLNFQAVGNVAWAKLNSKSLIGPDAMELADYGIGSLQKAAELNPKNPKLFGLQASIYNFRAMQQGASWAAALDRASAQDLQRVSRVLAEEAKKAAGGAIPGLTTPNLGPTPTPAPKAGG